MPSYTIVARPDDLSKELKFQTEQVLKAHGYEENEASCDTVFVIGGDGTFLYAVHQFIDRLNEVKFFGIHTGTFGFYTDYRYTDFDEIRIENAARTQAMDVYINNRMLEQYRGTGMCVSTQLGSTAYNRSLGGAVIAEGLPVIEMTEMSGIHHNKYHSLKSPLILSDQCSITFVSDNFAGALLGADSEVFPMDKIRKLTIRVSKDKCVRMLKGRKVDYFDRLQALF